jgi:NADPH:quinone reductase-like Zn-dependent oxidoreductase
MEAITPATFPSGEGSDFAGIIEAIGPGVTKFKVNDEVAGYTHKRASHAEYIVESQDNITIKPANVSWEVAGSLFVAGTTAYAAVKAVGIEEGDKVIVSGAAGGVGSIASQLAIIAGAKVYGIAGEHDHEWLKSLNIMPINYNGDVATDISKTVGKPDELIDTSGRGYVKMAIDIGVDPQKIDTIIDFEAAQTYKVKSEGSSTVDNKIEVLEELLAYIANHKLEVPIAKTFALENVKEAFTYIATEHHRGKVVLVTDKESSLSYIKKF